MLLCSDRGRWQPLPTTVIVDRDSIELYLSPLATPTLVGRFSDTTLVLAPPGGITKPTAQVDSIGLHAWRLRPGGQ